MLGAVIVLIEQMRRQRHREIKYPAAGHTVGKWLSQVQRPGFATQSSLLPATQ